MSKQTCAQAALIVAALTPQVSQAALVGEGTSKSITATKVRRAPIVDGRLDDAVWQLAKPDRRFTQQFPIDGAAPTVVTVIRVLFDDDNLYIGVTAHDPAPTKIVRRLARRDRQVDADYVEVMLDSRHDHDSGLIFRVNAAGVLGDEQLHDDTRRNREFDAVWRGRAVPRSDGWSVELAIPLSVFRFASDVEQEWGFNVVRYVARSKETLMWVHVPQNEPGGASRGGHLVGLGRLPEVRTLELRPFLLGKIDALLPEGGGASIGAHSEREFGASAGLDVKYGLTSNLTLDASINPDFGQVEADEVVLNLSRFEAFFPEKRPFLLESADLFHTDLRLFYSRRLGAPTSGLVPLSVASADGQELDVVDTPLFVPIWAAARITGRLGPRLTIAAVDAVTGPEVVTGVDSSGRARQYDASPARNYAASRVKLGFGGSSYLGFIATARTDLDDAELDNEGHDSYAESLDGRWVAADGSYRAYFQVAATHRVGGPSQADASCTGSQCPPNRRIDGETLLPGDVGFAGEFGGGQFGAEHWTLYSRYRFATRRFDSNDVGFESDWNYHKGVGRLTLRERRPFWWFQNAEFVAHTETSRALDGTHRSTSAQLSHAALHSSFWRHSVYLRSEPFKSYSIRETFDGARWERARTWGAGASLSSDTRRPLRGVLSGAIGDGIADPQRNWSLASSAYVQPIPALEVSSELRWAGANDVLRFYSCETSDMTTCSASSMSRDYTVARLSSSTLSLTGRAGLSLSPTMSVQGYVQVFAARGRFADYQQLRDLGPGAPKLRRDALEPSAETGDNDGDGVKDDDFAFASLNANLLFRWEIWPGTVFVAAYTRAQRRDDTLEGRRPRLGIDGLSSGRTEEVGLLKLTLFF